MAWTRELERPWSGVIWRNWSFCAEAVDAAIASAATTSPMRTASVRRREWLDVAPAAARKADLRGDIQFGVSDNYRRISPAGCNSAGIRGYGDTGIRGYGDTGIRTASGGDCVPRPFVVPHPLIPS